jgi:diaminohydroxyphosphoribosylaminopyrimidine deaminase/5-amino-6-(5-phosphoribosylamino)uracil reductase
MEILNDQYYMNFALQLASVAQGQTSINPVVGCVIVRNGEIVGFGAHLKRGQAHAEVHALLMAGDAAQGSTAYVTLEPCCHYGKTPPCADQLIEAGVSRVVVAAVDPNPLVAGKGISHLRSNGIQVDVGILSEKSEQLNETFNHFITTKQPFVTFKTATTLDGKIATENGDSKWITNEQSREYVHMLRHQHQAIMVGIGTVLADNPSLTTRLSVPGIHPIRIVVDSKLRIPLDCELVVNHSAETWVLTTESAPIEKTTALEAKGVKVIRCGYGEQVDLKMAMSKLGELEISSVLLEGGGTLAGAMLESELIQKIIWFVAPKFIGGIHAPTPLVWKGKPRMKDAIQLDQFSSEQFGTDVLLKAYVRYAIEES